MSVDVSKIKVGDEVTVRATVRANDGSDDLPVCAAPVNSSSTDYEWWFRPDDILSHTPKGFAVGDRVKVRGDEAEGEIKAVWADSAWVLFTTDNEPVTLPNSCLERL